jgi:poly(hydroxyalkanoate) depolymerase family esterase
MHARSFALQHLVPMALGLSVAACSAPAPELETERVAVSSSALGAQLTAVTGFGSNPGALKMFEYVPSSVKAGAPVVVALHGCTQTADAVLSWGLTELADKHGFVLVVPEQQTTNNSARCFNWGGDYGNMTPLKRGQDENMSIKQMVDKTIATHASDPKRVYAMGFSAGAAQAVLLAATWPEVYAAVASFAGIPYACPKAYADVFPCQNGAVSKTPAQWGDLARGGYAGHAGPWPRVSVWQGSSDVTVGTKNRGNIVAQWTDVHGVTGAPSVTETVAGAKHELYKNAAGAAVVETYEVPGMGHGVPIAAGCGVAGTYQFDKGICGAELAVAFFGIGTPGTAATPDAGSSSSGGSNSGASSSGGAGGSSGAKATGPNGAAADAGNSSGNAGSPSTPEWGGERSAESTCSASPGVPSPGAFALFASVGCLVALRRRRKTRA